MNLFFRIFFWGMLISFLGSLPPGTMNMAALHISAQQGMGEGFIYATGSMLAEVTIVRIALVSIKWMVSQHRLFYWFEILTLILLMAMAWVCFTQSPGSHNFSNDILQRSSSPFWLGLVLSTINPLHIPFWLGWSTVLMNKNILQTKPNQYNWYVSGIGLGTMLGFSVFIFGGIRVVDLPGDIQHMLNLVIGFALLFTVVLHLKKMITVPAAVRYSKISGRL
jgi:threonine/homoserine/homoserine lactone efflux protein